VILRRQCPGAESALAQIEGEHQLVCLECDCQTVRGRNGHLVEPVHHCRYPRNPVKRIGPS
jgi:hypothetical protein